MTKRRALLIAFWIGSFHAIAACGSSSDDGGGSSGTGGSGTGGSGTGGSGTGGSGTGGSGTGGATGTCRGGSDCSGGEFCAVYTLPPICGGVYDTGSDNCQDDSDCADGGVNFICDSQLCVFPHGGGIPFHCKKGCAAQADCGPGLDCDAMHRCVPRACGAPGDCDSANFDCSASQCAPKPCSSDGQCADFCVNGGCSATVGQCQPAVP